LDPGAHVFSVTHPGYNSALVNRTLAASSTPDLAINLAELSAAIRVAANVPQAVVAVDGLDIGLVPVQVTRPAGRYSILVRKGGYEPYVTVLQVGPGEQPNIRAVLSPEKTPLYKNGWFWVAAGALVSTAAVVTYFLARPAPQRPAPDGGGLGWVVSVPSN
jgi:hypothetical protein